MQPEQFSSEIETHRSFAPLKCLLWLHGLGTLGIVLVLGGLPAQAETESSLESSEPLPVEASPPMAPVETSAEALLSPQITAEPTPEPAIAAPTMEPAPTETAPPSVISVTEKAPSADLPAAESAIPDSFNNVFIDPTDYSLGATPSLDTPSLIFSDRTTGCQFSLQQGQSTPSHSCSNTANSGANGTANGGQNDYVTYGSPIDGEGAQFSVGPLSVGGQGVTVGNTTIISREYFNEKLRSLNLMRRGAQEFVFPLAIPSPITSLFGWRIHPIFGDRRFHTGTDLGAPEGTPVVATQDGEVHIADYLGGYGLTVILRHAEGSLETRYAHLSRILVRPGEVVKQGEVVGLVGSTGNSTGPHLHFELRELTAQGWILLNPNELMGYAMANLADTLNNPLLALGLEADDKSASDKAEADQSLMPYRPAQPNAN
ncbi:MAG: peptidoglycan DD-metalloendopeptidase family protein [Cyanobacteria bacterium P01_C01_bin.120]